MRALTLYPEWIWVIIRLGKPIENRTWPPPEWIIGEDLALHAGTRRPTAGALELVTEYAMKAGWNVNLGRGRPGAPLYPYSFASDYIDGGKPRFFNRDKLVMGAITSVVRIGRPDPDCQSTWRMPGQIPWPLENVRHLAKPVPCRGWQKIWNMPPDVEAQVLAQL